MYYGGGGFGFSPVPGPPGFNGGFGPPGFNSGFNTYQSGFSDPFGWLGSQIGGWLGDEGWGEFIGSALGNILDWVRDGGTPSSEGGSSSGSSGGWTLPGFGGASGGLGGGGGLGSLGVGQVLLIALAAVGGVWGFKQIF